MGFGSKDKNLDNRKYKGGEVKEALEKGQTILALIEDEVSEKSKLDCADFFESVTDGVKGVCETIEKNGSVSDKQLRSLTNWEAAVRKFIR